ncbi:hypothetical protein HN832_03180 [archaeon]|jgi:hypothetical protein|nr:hypothetical protein [archaeon]MBT4373601.1 hypothetical protein [archaeon]MBT4532049.1 hypothetical protein [archaeon]MBT7001716.1 hypothetical protein [archaeon]MBT7282392.1 hypothetical protein [archaeon]
MADEYIDGVKVETAEEHLGKILTERSKRGEPDHEGEAFLLAQVLGKPGEIEYMCLYKPEYTLEDNK